MTAAASRSRCCASGSTARIRKSTPPNTEPHRPGYDYLVTGHESFGQVVEVGPNVPSTIQPGTYVVASVRRPGSSIYGTIGLQDFTTDDVYFERGINLLHGYLTEYYVEDFQYVFPLPAPLPRWACC